MRIRGVVLAAGLGTRLRPLTHSLPKPLLPVAGKPLLERTLAELEAAGCEAVAINLHHLGERISARFGTAFGSMELAYFWEDEIQGTLGALAPMADFLAEADLIVLVNGDSLCHWPVPRLIKHHQKRGGRATLLVSTRPDPAGFGGGVGLDGDDRIISFSPARDRPDRGTVEERRVFAGAHVFSPELVQNLEARPADFVTDLYEPMLDRGEPIVAYESSRPWYDLGTPGRYLDAARKWERRRGATTLSRRSWISPEAKVDEGATVRRSVVEAGAAVDAGGELERALVLPGARIGAGAQVKDSIIGLSVRLRPGTAVERRMVTAARADQEPGVRDSVIDGLVYSPL